MIILSNFVPMEISEKVSIMYMLCPYLKII